jgi:hypothetical protein
MMIPFTLAIRATICGMFAVISLSLAPMVSSQQTHQRPKGVPPKTAIVKEAKTGWYTFRGPDHDFSLDFPSKPKRVEDIQGPVTVLRRYASFTEDTYFEISIQDTGGLPDSTEANELSPKYEENMARQLAEDGTKIVQIRRLSKGSFEMELWFPALSPSEYQHGLRRGVIHKGRQYHYGCNSLIIGKEVNRDVCRRFLNSFRITGPPQ